MAVRKMCLCSNLDTALESLWWGSFVPLMMEGACSAGLHLRLFRKKRWRKNCVHNWKIKIGPSAGRKEQGDLLWKLRRWCGIKMDWRRKRKCFFFFHLSSYSFILFRASVAYVLMKGTGRCRSSDWKCVSPILAAISFGFVGYQLLDLLTAKKTEKQKKKKKDCSLQLSCCFRTDLHIYRDLASYLQAAFISTMCPCNGHTYPEQVYTVEYHVYIILLFSFWGFCHCLIAQIKASARTEVVTALTHQLQAVCSQPFAPAHSINHTQEQQSL